MEITRTNEVYTYTENAEANGLKISAKITKNLSTNEVVAFEQGSIVDVGTNAQQANFKVYLVQGSTSLNVADGCPLASLSVIVEEFITAVQVRVSSSTPEIM